MNPSELPSDATADDGKGSEGSQAAHAKAIAWFVARLKAHGVDCPAMQEGVRRGIIDGYLEWAICGKGPDGKATTYGESFQRAFGRELMPAKARA